MRMAGEQDLWRNIIGDNYFQQWTSVGWLMMMMIIKNIWSFFDVGTAV